MFLNCGMKRTFTKELDFLLFARGSKKNKELLSYYFSHKYKKKPETFYEFLHHFKKELKKKPESETKNLASKYLEFLSPECEKFGFFEEKHQLDLICFKFLHQKEYQRINNFLAIYKRKSRRTIKQIIDTLSEILRKNQYNFEIKGRYKSIYSIYKKLHSKPHTNILSLKDLFAFRIIVKNNSIDDCFEILNLVHDHFSPITDFFKDYITIPKINGYQSLHTGLENVIPNLNIPVEIQIRTQSMHDFAEKGMAAHWIYTKDKKSKILTHKEKHLFEFYHQGKVDPEDQMVYFCSFEGDIFKLKRGSTILDFGYHLHSEIGNKAEYALVNNDKKDLHYEIQPLDKIQIITARERKVNRQWLKETKNKTTRKKIYEATRS